MTAQGILVKNIYVDKQSGKDFNRPRYRALLRKLHKDDILYLSSIDRLGRNYGEVQNQWRIITREKKADIVVLDMPLLDTRRGKDLIGTFIADLVLQVLSFVAQQERENIKKRQAEGIAAAKSRGVAFGRREVPLPPEFLPAFESYMSGEISGVKAAQACGMATSTFYYKAKHFR